MSSLADDWSYQLAQSVLSAALSCGATCERVFVSDACAPEGLPPGCPCQLSVVVSEGWEALPSCGARRVAELRIVLDLCTSPVPDEHSISTVEQLNTSAQAQSAMRWQIMRGLREAWHSGELGGCDGMPAGVSCCSRWSPGVWRCVRSGGGSARWESVWRYSSDG